MRQAHTEDSRRRPHSPLTVEDADEAEKQQAARHGVLALHHGDHLVWTVVFAVVSQRAGGSTAAATGPQLATWNETAWLESESEKKCEFAATVVEVVSSKREGNNLEGGGRGHCQKRSLTSHRK